MVRDRESWHAAVHGVAKWWTRLSDSTTTMTVRYRNVTPIELHLLFCIFVVCSAAKPALLIALVNLNIFSLYSK